MKPAQILLVELTRAARSRKHHEHEDRAKLAALLLEAKRHPGLTMDLAAGAADVGRVTAYVLAREAE